MLAAADVGQSVVAAILALGTAGLGGAIVAMVWHLQLAQVQRGGRLGGQHAADPAGGPLPASGVLHPGLPAPGVRGNGGPATVANGNGAQRRPGATPQAPAQAGKSQAGNLPPGNLQAEEARPAAPAVPSAIEGPDSVVIGEQARYRVRYSAVQQVVSWTAGGGAVSQASDPAHPDDLLLVADRPGNLTVSVRLREGLAERRETKAVTALAPPPTGDPAVAWRLLLQDWPIVTVAVLVAGFAAALVALGSLGVGDFIALVAPLTAVLAVVAATRANTGRPGR